VALAWPAQRPHELNAERAAPPAQPTNPPHQPTNPTLNMSLSWKPGEGGGGGR
jgi:hypothetical protein